MRGKCRSIRRARCCRSNGVLLFSSGVKCKGNVAESGRPWGRHGSRGPSCLLAAPVAGPSYVPTVGPCMPTAQEGLREGPRLCADSVCLEVSEHSLGLGLGSPRLEEGQAASDPQLLYSPQWF